MAGLLVLDPISVHLADMVLSISDTVHTLPMLVTLGKSYVARFSVPLQHAHGSSAHVPGAGLRRMPSLCHLSTSQQHVSILDSSTSAGSKQSTHSRSQPAAAWCQNQYWACAT